MPSIGALNFAFLSSPTEPPAEKLLEVTRAHVDGVALKKIGTQGPPHRMVGTLGAGGPFDPGQTVINSCKALAGQILTLVDDHGDTWNKVAIRRVRIRKNMGVARVAGVMAGATRIIVAEFECQDTRPAR